MAAGGHPGLVRRGGHIGWASALWSKGHEFESQPDRKMWTLRNKLGQVIHTHCSGQL